MQTIISYIALLSDVTAILSYIERRKIKTNLLNIIFVGSINPLSLPDEEFTFFHAKERQWLDGSYLPVSFVEERLCKSLINLHLLKQANNSKYKLSGLGKKVLISTKAGLLGVR